MGEGDASHDATTADPAPPAADRRPRRWVRRTAAVIVIGLAAGAGVAWWYDVPDRLWGPDPATEPAAVEPPRGLRLPEAAVPRPVADPVRAGRANAARVADAVEDLVSPRRLGRRVSVVVADLQGRELFDTRAGAVIPASTIKILGAAAALAELGPDHRFATTVVREGRRLVLVGGGDPLLTGAPGPADEYPRPADLTTLAEQTARSLLAEGVTRVRLGYDTSLFVGSGAEATWEPNYLPDDVVSPIVPLWVDGGREVAGSSIRSEDPARAAAAVFASALRSAGVDVVRQPSPQLAGPAMTQVAAVTSAPLAQIVQRTLEVSDNEASEVLNRHVALARGVEPSFRGGAAAVQESLGEQGVSLRGARIVDGSGLSRANRLEADTILDVLALAAAQPRLRTVLTGLPVAGFSGSLAARFEGTPDVALGEVKAKTGTLTGVNGLAGTVTTADGLVLAFVAVADRVRPVNTLFARSQLDRIAAALAACTCR